MQSSPDKRVPPSRRGGEGEPAPGALQVEKQPPDRCGRAEEEASAPARPALALRDRGPSLFPPLDRDPLAEPRTWP